MPRFHTSLGPYASQLWQWSDIPVLDDVCNQGSLELAAAAPAVVGAPSDSGLLIVEGFFPIIGDHLVLRR